MLLFTQRIKSARNLVLLFNIHTSSEPNDAEIEGSAVANGEAAEGKKATPAPEGKLTLVFI